MIPSNYFPKQHQPIEFFNKFCNKDALFFWGNNWIFRYYLDEDPIVREREKSRSRKSTYMSFVLQRIKAMDSISVMKKN
jgi:hypothetical protein